MSLKYIYSEVNKFIKYSLSKEDCFMNSSKFFVFSIFYPFCDQTIY